VFNPFIVLCEISGTLFPSTYDLNTISHKGMNTCSMYGIYVKLHGHTYLRVLHIDIVVKQKGT